MEHLGLGFHDFLQIGQLIATLVLAPLTHVLWGIKKEIAEFKLFAARNYVTKDDLKEHKCAT